MGGAQFFFARAGSEIDNNNQFWGTPYFTLLCTRYGRKTQISFGCYNLLVCFFGISVGQLSKPPLGLSRMTPKESTREEAKQKVLQEGRIWDSFYCSGDFFLIFSPQSKPLKPVHRFFWEYWFFSRYQWFLLSQSSYCLVKTCCLLQNPLVGQVREDWILPKKPSAFFGRIQSSTTSSKIAGRAFLRDYGLMYKFWHCGLLLKVTPQGAPWRTLRSKPRNSGEKIKGLERWPSC